MTTRSRGVGTWVRYAILWVLAVLFLLPFYVIFRNAFSTDRGFAAAKFNWWPDLLTPGADQPWYVNLQTIFSDTSVSLATSMLHSAVVSVVQTVGIVVIALMAAYALARHNTRASRLVLGLTLLTLMVPATVTFIPMFVMTASLGWIDSYRGLIVPGLFSALAAYMFRGHFLGFPHELEEAAAIDGASPWGTFWRVVVPNSKGIIAAVGTIIFIGSWNAFLWPMLVARDNTKTVQVALSQFMTSQGVEYPELFTGALIAVLPVLILFLFLQRYLVAGVERSGLSG